jgi:polyisoprenoid-binding protein YceI
MCRDGRLRSATLSRNGRSCVLRFLALLVLLAPGAAFAAPWRLSPETTVVVDVDWQGARIPVRFPTVAGEIEFDERDPAAARATIAVGTRDVVTGIPPADLLARSEGYLAAERFPQILFVLDRLVRTSPSTAEVSGRITFRGVTRPIGFEAVVFRFGPAADDPARFEAGFTLTGAIDRTAFGSTGGLPAVAAVLPVRIRLLMTSR